MHKANFDKNTELRDVLNGLDSSKFSELSYSNTTLDKFSIYQVKITFKHLSFTRKVYLTCRKRHKTIVISNVEIIFISQRFD